MEEHLPQKIWPHARQWCCDTERVSVRRGAGLLTPCAHPSHYCLLQRAQGWASQGGQKAGLGGHKDPREMAHFQALNCSHCLREKSN